MVDTVKKVDEDKKDHEEINSPMDNLIEMRGKCDQLGKLIKEFNLELIL